MDDSCHDKCRLLQKIKSREGFPLALDTPQECDLLKVLEKEGIVKVSGITGPIGAIDHAERSAHDHSVSGYKLTEKGDAFLKSKCI